ncbi:MAG: GNAT family N-acetyltransferase [Proteobacteria bacterium]|nr:GNAT family N-acetyltransferase [Pseudomonadota bacterium]
MHTLSAAGLVLEPLCERHAALMWPLLSDARLHIHLDESAPASLDALQQRYRRWEAHRVSPDGQAHWLNWVMRVQDHAVGWLQATVQQDGSAWVAYVVGTAHQGQGLARRGVQALLDHLRRDHRCTRALAQVEAANGPSIALLQALGFEPMAVAPHPLTPTERVYERRLESPHA